MILNGSLLLDIDMMPTSQMNECYAIQLFPKKKRLLITSLPFIIFRYIAIGKTANYKLKIIMLALACS